MTPENPPRHPMRYYNATCGGYRPEDPPEQSKLESPICIGSDITPVCPKLDECPARQPSDDRCLMKPPEDPPVESAEATARETDGMPESPRRTPGPWRLEWSKKSPALNVLGANDYPIVRVPVHPNIGDDDEANGHLIAAAYDLDYELGGIADALAAGDTVTIEPGSVKAVRIAIAIAKAAGKEVGS